jgi:hypothetical protein
MVPLRMLELDFSILRKGILSSLPAQFVLEQPALLGAILLPGMISAFTFYFLNGVLRTTRYSTRESSFFFFIVLSI